MDTTLPIITRTAGQQFVVVSIFHGFVVDFSVPFLVTLFCSKMCIRDRFLRSRNELLDKIRGMIKEGYKMDNQTLIPHLDVYKRQD